MTPDEYQIKALRTENTPSIIGDVGDADDRRMSRLLHAAIGICTEAGELQDALKRHLFYNKPLDITNVMEEISDVLWYCALGLDAAGYKMSEAMERNIAKLRARFPDKFTEDKALNRDLDAETKALRDRGDWTNIDGDKTNNTPKTERDLMEEICAMHPSTQVRDAQVILRWRRAFEQTTPVTHEFHAMEALTRIVHRLGIDAPQKLVSSVNKRLADMACQAIDELRQDARTFRERLEKVQVALLSLT